MRSTFPALAGITLTALLTFGSGVAVAEDSIDKDCGDFTSQTDAQSYFDSEGGSVDNNVDGLDRDGDGIACEEHVYAPPVTSTQPTPPPTSEPTRTTSSPAPAPEDILTVVSGSGQHTTVGTTFPSPLVVKVTDSDGNPVAGADVQFTIDPVIGAGSSGASATFADGSTEVTVTTVSEGLAVAEGLVANGFPGSHGVTASLTGTDGSPVIFDLTNDPAATSPTSTNPPTLSPRTSVVINGNVTVNLLDDDDSTSVGTLVWLVPQGSASTGAA